MTFSPTPQSLPPTFAVTETPQRATLPPLSEELPQGANATVSGQLGVNLRDGPSYSHAVLGVLEVGQPLVLIGRTEDHQWFQAVTFETPPRTVWTLAELIAPRFDTRLLGVTWSGRQLALSGVGCGMNLDPKRGQGWPNVPADLGRVGWVRFGFLASRQHFDSLDAAFHFYDPIIAAYHDMGVRVLLVLTHEMYGEGYQWEALTSAEWQVYSAGFAETAGRIAAHYRHQVAAYEIWNESDVEAGNPAAVALTPPRFARLLSVTSPILRANAPDAYLLSGGLLDPSATYLRNVQRALGGPLPIDGIALHPYGRGAAGETGVFASFGELGEVIQAYQSAFPSLPIWITEAGAIGDNNPARWAEAARYMQNLYHELRTAYDSEVNTLIWYAWSDSMHPEQRINGLVTTTNQPKSPLYETFFSLCGT